MANKNDHKAEIFYYDIGDYLSREQKLKKISDFGSMANLQFVNITPNEHGDWISQRNDKFSSWIALEPIDKFSNDTQTFFSMCSNGLKTGRDAWSYCFSQKQLEKQISDCLDFYETQRQDFIEGTTTEIKFDTKKISWDESTMNKCKKGSEIKFDNDFIMIGHYRPFCKQNLYFDSNFIQRVYRQNCIFPKKDSENLIIAVSGLGSTKDFSAIISDFLPDLGFNAACQCFPLYWYGEIDEKNRKESFDFKDYQKHEAISDFILDRARTKYGNKVSKEDIFYYVYGILHSKSYRETFSADLKKMLPRLPLVSDYQKFWDFVDAGRKLADLHLNYENIAPCSDVVVTGDDKNDFAVTQMKFVKKGEKHTILFNDKITVSNIPAKAYDYIVNGKSAIEWIMERYAITTDKKSGITNNPNDWASEHNKPRYILDLLLSVINVSVQTADIVNALPEVDWNKE